MSSGRNHDKGTRYLSLGILGLSPALVVFDINPVYGLIIAASEFIGGYYLSPDLDGCSLPSRPFKRWGVLSIYWIPYRNIIPHRHWVSHSPIVSSFIRIAYLLIPFELLSNLLVDFSLVSYLTTIPEYALAVFIGVEISCLLHLVMDYWLVFK